MEQELLSRLDALAAKLGVTATHLWEVLVAQQALRWMNVVAEVVALGVAAGLLYVSCKVFGKHKDSGDMEEIVSFIGMLLFAVASAGVLFCIIGDGTTAIKATINPEFYALQEVLKVLGK